MKLMKFKLYKLYLHRPEKSVIVCAVKMFNKTIPLRSFKRHSGTKDEPSYR